MKGRLSSLSSGSTLGFSPFVDVAVNSMAAMFIFLIAYVAAVPPQAKPARLRFTNTELPSAIWLLPYRGGVSATGGVGDHRYELLEPARLPPGLQFDGKTGLIRGVPRAAAVEDNKLTATISLRVRVRDGGGMSAESEAILKIDPVSVPFDPVNDKVRFAQGDIDDTPATSLPIAWEGKPYRADIAVIGGIEKYEFKAENLPPGLEFKNERIEGTPTRDALAADGAPRVWPVVVTVTDQQGGAGIAAPAPARRTFAIQVNPSRPLTLTPFLPLGTAGQPYSGAILASGAQGQYRWSVVDPAPLTAAGLTLNPETGVISSQAVKTNSLGVMVVQFKVRVTAWLAGEGETTQVIDATIRVQPRMSFVPLP